MKTVIVPTLNEEENIEPLIRSIFESMGVEDVSIIIVDDNSTDRTHEIIRGLIDEFKNMRLIVRTDVRGLGSAVRRGAMEARPGPVVVMDADLSHNPKNLPDMFQKLKEGFDVVVGSRYVKGGRIVGWPGSRIAMSKGATIMARVLLQVSVHDPMSGFVACRSGELLAKGIEVADYKFLLEMLARNRSLRVTEVPIIFQDRVRGKSKLDEITMMLFLTLVLRLFFKRYSN